MRNIQAKAHVYMPHIRMKIVRMRNAIVRVQKSILCLKIEQQLLVGFFANF